MFMGLFWAFFLYLFITLFYVSFTLDPPFFFFLFFARSGPLDIDQLMCIMKLTGTPSDQLLVKLGSEEVLAFSFFTTLP